MKLTSSLLVVLILTGGAAARAENPQPGNWVRILEKGPRQEWSAAIDSLLALKKLPPQAVSTLVRRLDVMDVDDRRRFAKALNWKVLRPETLEAAIRLLSESEPDTKTSKYARRAIASCDREFATEILISNLSGSQPHPRLDWLALLLADRWREEEAMRRQVDSIDAVTVLDDVAKGCRFPVFDVLSPLLSHSEAKVREAAVRSLWYVGDVRVHDAVKPLSNEADPLVRLPALRLLASRGDLEALAPLLKWADTEAPVTRRWHRNRRFERVGYAFAHTHFAELLELYRRAASESQRLDYVALVEGGVSANILSNEATLAVMERYTSDPDEFISSTAKRILRWKDRRSAPSASDGLSTSLLVCVALAAALVGFVLFHWAFRLLGLRRLFRSATPTPIRSLALGHVTIEGKVRARGPRLTHPYTGEACVYYPGADRHHRAVEFAVEDGTGEVIVDARQLVTLSEDGIVEEGERVFLVGTARRKGQSIEIAKDESPRPIYARCVHFVVRHVLGHAAKSGSARLLFSDPSRCFCVWDDLHNRPFACWRESAITFGSIALIGAWVCVFAIAGLAIVDQELSAKLRTSLHGLWETTAHAAATEDVNTRGDSRPDPDV